MTHPFMNISDRRLRQLKAESDDFYKDSTGRHVQVGEIELTEDIKNLEKRIVTDLEDLPAKAESEKRKIYFSALQYELRAKKDLLDLLVASGKLCDIKVVEKTWITKFKLMQSLMLSIPKELSNLMPDMDATHVIELEKLIRKTWNQGIKDGKNLHD